MRNLIPGTAVFLAVSFAMVFAVSSLAQVTQLEPTFAETLAPTEAVTPSDCPHCGGSTPKPSAGCKTCCCGTLIDWSKYPETIHPMHRPGIFPVSPKGPGYYTAWDHLIGQCRPAPKNPATHRSRSMRGRSLMQIGGMSSRCP